MVFRILTECVYTNFTNITPSSAILRVVDRTDRVKVKMKKTCKEVIN